MATTFTSSESSGGGVKLSLFANQIIRISMVIVGCAFSVYLGLQITNPDANGLAISVQYIAAAAFMTAVVAPKTGIYLVLFMCPYLDFVKRLLILFSDVSMMDVTTVLAMAPVVMAGCVIGTFGSRLLLRKTLFEPGEKPLFLLTLATCSLITFISVIHNLDSKMELLHELGESCVYLSLLYLVPVHFATPEQIAKLLRCVVLAFTPVAIYGFWQMAFGLSDFENRYLLTGLTVTSGDYFGSGRVFSTLNSNHAFSICMAFCAIISWMLRYLPAEKTGSVLLKSSAWFFLLLFTVACLTSLRRTGWLVLGFSMLGAYCFRYRRRTQFFYAICLGLLVTLILNASSIYTELPYWEGILQGMFPGFDQALQLQTFNDRLGSFETLTTNPNIWSFFGVPASEQSSVYVHDAITQTIMGYGVVGTTAFIIVLLWVLTISHRVIWRAKDETESRYASLLLATVFANIFVGAVMQSHIGIFPINFLFWLCAGALTTVTFKRPAIEAAVFDMETLRAIIDSSEKRAPQPAAVSFSP